LSLHRKDPNGKISEIAYLGSQRTQANAAQIKQTLGDGDALLLVHGIIGDTKGMVESVFERETLHKPFAGVLAYDYENLTSGIEAAAQKLKQMLLDCGFGEGKRLTIVAHSMGGLVSRYLIEHLEGDRFVKKLIQCGTPNSGSEIADFRRKLTGWLAAGMNGVALFQPYMAIASFLGRRLEKGLFRTLDEMDPDSDFLKELNASGKSDPGVPYYLIGGDTSQIEAAFPEDASLIKKVFALLSTRGIYQGLDLAVFDKAPNDMAVKVERMKDLPWGSHDVAQILECDHVSYFNNPVSIRQIENLVEKS
jgi:triacylglycerol esterase/lipase EstA (alpha/beta hydrolase family)